ncbi:MAG: polysaccharide biosynthesis C-terminal domain-containing protein, partial [Clostridia bacterium]|nr:polysaccharide biosynthesis C-terminal domain-containing protein [Clostridia bacterium]
MSTKIFSLKKRDMDMTKGSVVKNLLSFAFPLLLGNLFQQLYNMVDTYVIGQTGINEAYAAVGSVAPIINILIGSFMGLAGGVGVIISQNFGAKRFDEVEKVTHTAIILTAILSVVFAVLGVVLTPVFLNLMLRSDANGSAIYPYASEYLTIYFAGVGGLLFYNMGSGILRAIGDSNRPFYFLLISAILNVILDCVFVFGFNMGVDGVAYATIIAQGISAIITVITLFKTTTCVKISFNKMKLNGGMLSKIFKIGTPSALQMAFTAFSNLFVMSYISNVNGDTTLALSGWTTYSKVDMILFMPIQSLALAV